MRVQLFNPPTHHYQGGHYRMNPALGLPILSAILNAAGHTCEVTDLEALRVTPEALAQGFASQRDRWPDWVGFTALTDGVRGARECIAALRGVGYDGQVAVGGVHATLCPEDPLAWGADLVVTGECEGNVVRLLAEGARGIHKGEPLPIQLIPAPDWDRHNPPPTRYQGNYPLMGTPQSISMWSRGCPHGCIFCGNAIFGHQAIRYRPPSQVAAEMGDLRRRHVRSVFVYDDELVGVRQPEGWMTEVCDRIASLGLTWKCQGRCSQRQVSVGALRTMYRGGCRIVMWGVESFSQNVLTAIRKGTSPADIWHTLRAGKEAGLQNFAFTMVGNYRETETDLAETAKALGEAYQEGLIDYRQTTVVTALPGTQLWEIQHREGWWHQPPETGPQMHQAYQSTPWLKADRITYWLRKFDEACPVGAAGRLAA